jgi:hypothetical protein
LIGFIPGTASGALAFNSAYHLPETLWRFLNHLWNHPADVPGGLTLGTFCFFSSKGPGGVAQGVMANEKNIIFINDVKNKLLATVDIHLNEAAGGSVNTRAAINTVYPKPKPTPANVTLGEVQEYAANVDAHLVHRHTADSFRNFLGDLKKVAAPAKNDTEDEEIDMKRSPSFLNQEP